MKRIVSFLFISLCCSTVFAQYITVDQYVQQYKDIAISEMKRMGVPAAISLAQGILETENGNSDLVKKSNNHFGIKCKSTWTAETISHDDDAPGECFRVYKTAEDSYRDHSNFLRGSDRYAFLFKLAPTDYKGWAYGLRKAGYATNPRYPEILIKNIEANNLEQYTLEAAGQVPVFDASKYSNDKDDSSANNGELSKPSKLTINGCKALFVSKGTSLLAIATQNDINLSRLLEINDIEKDGLLERDQFIFLEKKRSEGTSDYYIAQQDENLYDVAQKNGILLQSLYDYNNLSAADNIYPGTKILLRPTTNITVNDKYRQSDADAESAKPKTHKVQPSEGLYSISKKYGVTVADLREWNNLKNDHLRIGQQLIISK
jgi:LysM repeat protein